MGFPSKPFPRSSVMGLVILRDVIMNDDVAEIQECLGRHGIECACVRFKDGRTLESDCSCRCMRLLEHGGIKD
jgi:hypothetical protein